jgi:2-iminobutanoate/2-iminopropanoate deaminase
MPASSLLMRRVAAVAASTLLLGTSACRLNVVRRPAAVVPEYIQPDGPPANPFSPAVRVGTLVFVSGTLGTKADGALVPGGIEPETRQVLDNIKRTLAAAGLGMDRVVKCQAFLADLAEWPAMNAIYRGYFPNGKYPARTAVQATLLFGARVELECVAAG